MTVVPDPARRGRPSGFSRPGPTRWVKAPPGSCSPPVRPPARFCRSGSGRCGRRA